MSHADIVVDGHSLNISYGEVLQIGENLAYTNFFPGSTLISSDHIISSNLSVSNELLQRF